MIAERGLLLMCVYLSIKQFKKPILELIKLHNEMEPKVASCTVAFEGLATVRQRGCYLTGTFHWRFPVLITSKVGTCD